MAEGVKRKLRIRSGEHMRELRDDLGLTQKQLADRVGVRENTVWRHEQLPNFKKGIYASTLRRYETALFQPGLVVPVLEKSRSHGSRAPFDSDVAELLVERLSHRGHYDHFDSAEAHVERLKEGKEAVDALRYFIDGRLLLPEDLALSLGFSLLEQAHCTTFDGYGMNKVASEAINHVSDAGSGSFRLCPGRRHILAHSRQDSHRNVFTYGLISDPGQLPPETRHEQCAGHEQALQPLLERAREGSLSSPLFSKCPENGHDALTYQFATGTVFALLRDGRKSDLARRLKAEVMRCMAEGHHPRHALRVDLQEALLGEASHRATSRIVELLEKCDLEVRERFRDQANDDFRQILRLNIIAATADCTPESDVCFDEFFARPSSVIAAHLMRDKIVILPQLRRRVKEEVMRRLESLDDVWEIMFAVNTHGDKAA